MENYNIIAFAGRKRSGKTELSKFLKDEYGAIVITIASYLKELCANILNCDINTLLQMKDDGTTFRKKVGKRVIKLIHLKTNIPLGIIEKEIGSITFTNVRQMLQVIGTDLIRKYNPNWHVEQMINEIKTYNKTQLIAIDDVRFPNEKQAIEEMGGKVFFIIRTSNCLDVSNHLSETSLMWNDFDDKNIIINSKTINILQKKLQIWYNKMSVNIDEEAIVIPKQARIFGKDFNSDVERIVNKIKNDKSFNENGTVDFGEGVIINNPYITENLKKWL